MSAFWKTKGNNFNHERRWPTTVAPGRHFPTSILYVCVYQKRKKEKVKKKYMGRIYYSPWNESFFLRVAVASVTTGRVDVTKIQTKNYQFFWVLLSSGITAPENLFLQKILVPKGYSFQRRLNFSGFWRGWIDERIGGFWKYFCPDFGFKTRF